MKKKEHNKIETKSLVAYLKSVSSINANAIDRLKIAYRPLICPFDELLNAIPKNSKVYDIGCGSGMFLSLVNHFKSPSALGGIEISERLVANAKEVLNNSLAKEQHIQVFNGIDIPGVISAYNYIVMIDVFHHIPKKQQFEFLNQVLKKMSDNATLIFKDIEGGSVLKYWNKVHDLVLSGEMGNEARSRDIKDFFLTHKGIELIELSHKRMYLYPHYTFIIKKTGK